MYYFFYFPLGIERRLKRAPVLTLALAGALVLVHFFLNYFRPTVDLFYVLVLPTDAPTLFQAFTSCFVHAGLFHLVGNLIFLAAFGPALEDRLGRGRFLVFYMLGGLVSMLAQVEAYHALHPDAPPVYVLGASGAISAVLGLFGARCWFLRIRVAHATFAYLAGTARGGVTAVPAWAGLAAYVLLQTAYALLSLEGVGGGTAYWAHLAGLVFGFGVGLVTGQFREGLRERRLVRARRYFDRGEWFAALGEFETYRETAGPRAEGLLGEARTLRILARPGPARSAYARGFELLVDAGRWGEAAETVEETARTGLSMGLDPVRLRLLAGVAEADGELTRAADLYETAGSVDREPRRAANSLERAAEICRRTVGDLERAGDLFEDAAFRLAMVAAGDEEILERAQGLRRRGGECRRVLAKRIRFAQRSA